MTQGMRLSGLREPRTAIEAALLSDPESAWEFLNARSAWDSTVGAQHADRHATSLRDSPYHPGEQTLPGPGNL